MQAQMQPPASVRAAVEIREGVDARRIPLAGSRAVVGRAPDAQIRLDHGSVSRHHAELSRDPFGRWWVRDLGSRNGTSVNGRRITEQVVGGGDVVQVGACSFAMVLPNESTPRSDSNLGMTSRAGLLSSDADLETSTISTLRELEPPRLSATHLMTLSDLSQQLLNTADPLERREALCRLMTSDAFSARVAVVVRLDKAAPEDPPQVVCECKPGHATATPATRPGVATTPTYLSRSLLKAVRGRNEPVLASNVPSQSAMLPNSAAIEMSIAPSVMTASAVACPLQDDERHLEILYAILPPHYGTGEWLALAALATRQFHQAEHVWRARAAAEAHAALERELQRASQIQLRLVPQSPKIDGLDLAVGFSPCKWVGGDYVDVLTMSDGRGLLVVADVCGKGLAAALVTVSLHTMVNAGVTAGMDLPSLMKNLNQYLGRTLPPEAFVTMAAVAVDPKTGVVECINAGHPPALVLLPGTTPRSLSAGANLPLACDPDAELELETAQLLPGEMLFLFTDGLTEQTDPSGAMLLTAGLCGWLTESFPTPVTTAAATAGELMRRSEERRANRLPDDDRAFLLARRVI